VRKFEAIAGAVPTLLGGEATEAVDDAIAVLQILTHDLQTLLWRISNISSGPGAKPPSWMFKIDECRFGLRLGLTLL
jgi:hypothetical protein